MASETGLSAPFSSDPDSNWVARQGGLPPYMRRQARIIMRRSGLDEADAIPAGIRLVKRIATTGKDAKGREVDGRVLTLSKAAWREFKAKAAKARAESAARRS